MKQASAIPKHPIRFLLYVSRPFRWWAIGGVGISVIGSAIDQSLSLFFKFIVDAAEAGNMREALAWGLAFPVAIFLVQALWRVNGYFVMRWSIHVEEKTYNDLVGYTLGHSHGYFINRFAGSLLSKVSNVTSAMEEFIIQFTWTILNGLIAFLVSFVLIWTVDPAAAGIFAGLVAVLLLVNQWLAPKKRKLSQRAAQKATELRGSIVDLFTNVAAVRQFSAASRELVALKRETRQLRERHGANWFYTDKMLLINSFILFVFALGMFYSLIRKWEAGLISTGDFVLVIGLVVQVTGTLLFIGRAFNQTAKSLGEAREGLSDLLVPHEIRDKSRKKLVVSEGKIVWKKLKFTFGKTPVFEKFNLVIQPGQRVGLVGSSGAGKTTFLSLLLRQHEVKAGAIMIDGQNIAKVTQDSLREAIAVVPQEPMLFHRTIRENIGYGKPDATDAEIEQAARLAQAHDFIAALPEGYGTMVGERGVKLSGGQRQRVAIARAILKDAPILVLDEATSALDSESEVAIHTALHTLMRGKTVIAVAHRLSTLREMDRIIVLENGKIVEDGSHDALLGYGGIYARLWGHQAGGFLQE